MRTSISATLILALTRLFVKLTATQTDGAVVVDIQQNINPSKHYSYDNRFMDSITNIFDGSQLRIGDICRQTLGRMGQ